MTEFSKNGFAEALSVFSATADIGSFESCTVRSAHFCIDGTWMPVFTRIKFSRVRAPPPRTKVTFSRLELSEEHHNPTEVIAALSRHEFDGFGAHPHLYQTYASWSVITPGHTWYNWYPEPVPAYVLTRTGNAKPEDRLSHLYSRIAGEINTAIIEGSGPHHFASAIDAMDWWLERRGTVAQNGMLSGPIIEVVLPLPPGHVAAMSEEKGVLKADIEPFTEPAALMAHLAYRSGNQFICDSVQVTENMALFSHFPEGRYSIEIRSPEGLVSYFRGEASHIARSIGNETDQELVQRLLFYGERETCEYKDFGDRRKGDPNYDMLSREIPKTANAMANTDGGHILLGIDDKGIALGVNDFSKKLCDKFSCGHGELKELQGHLIHWCEKHVLLHLGNPPHCRYTWVKSEVGTMILMIRVAKNPTGVISELGPGDIYVRRGSSDRRATLEEILTIDSTHDS